MVATELGPDVRRLRRSMALGALGEGLLVASLPLLAAGMTHEPLAIAGIVVALRAPWLLFAAVRTPVLAASDRRSTLGALGALRAATVGALGLLALAGVERLTLVYAAALVIGATEGLVSDAADDAATAMVPPDQRDDARRALVTTALWAQGLGIPVGGLLFAVIPAGPFLADVLLFAMAALLGLLLPTRVAPQPTPPRTTPSTAADPSPARRRPRVLALATAAVAAGAAGSAAITVLVLVVLDRFEEGPSRFSLLLAVLAAATVAGALAAPRLAGPLGVTGGLLLALLVAGAGYVGAGVLDDAVPAASALTVATFAATAAVILLTAARYRVLGGRGNDDTHRRLRALRWAGVIAGAVAAGGAAEASDLRAPFYVAAGCCLLAAMLAPAAGRVPPPDEDDGTSGGSAASSVEGSAGGPSGEGLEGTAGSRSVSATRG